MRRLSIPHSSDIYPLLKKMEKHGFFTSEWILHGKKARKIFYPTEKSKESLAKYRFYMAKVVYDKPGPVDLEMALPVEVKIREERL